MNTSLRFPERSSMRGLLIACLLALTLTSFGGCKGRQEEHARRQHGRPGDFDSYVLALSWAPAFCAETSSHRTFRECDVHRHTGFVVHGLWPQSSDGGTLEYCGRVAPVSYAIVEQMLNIMPDRELIQHEWRVHGSCSGLSPREYFGAIKTAYSRVKIPGAFRSGKEMRTDPKRVQQLFQTSGAATPGAVRVACHQGELTEVRICLSRNLEPIPCSNELRECPASSLFVRGIP